MSGKVQGNIISVRQGDSFTLNFDLSKGCKPVNLTGATLAMQVCDDAGNIVFQCLGTPVDAAKGKVALILTPSMTSIPEGTYATDIQLTQADGNVDTVFPQDVDAVGVFRITKQITTYTPAPIEPEIESE